MSMNADDMSLHESQQDSVIGRLRIQGRRWRAQERSTSPSTMGRIEIRNRRRRYLEEHPEYFSSPSHELADPLAYDRLVRQFQSAAERESDGRRKGYSGILEADLLRADAKAQAVASSRSASGAAGGEAALAVSLDLDSATLDKERGLVVFNEIIESRFIDGDDDDFDYSLVDQNTAYDDKALERDKEDNWFDDEEPTNANSNTELEGQTGIQDF